MRLRNLLICLALISLLVLHACGENGTRPSEDAFRLDLTIVEPGGPPMEGLVISRLDHLDFEYTAGNPLQPMTTEAVESRVYVKVQAGSESAPPPPPFRLDPVWPNPTASSATGRLYSPVMCDVEFEYSDCKGDIMWSDRWMNLTGNTTLYTIWNVRDPSQNPVPNGIYSVTFTAYESGTDRQIFEETAWFAVWTAMDGYAASIGETGPDGNFSTWSKAFFGFIQGHQPMTSRDEMGVPGADFRFSPDVTVVATTPPPPGGTGYIYWMRREISLIDGPNDFEWVFVPDDSVFIAPAAR